MITNPVSVGDYICPDKAGRYGNIFKVVDINADFVVLRLVSETTPVHHHRRFYKNSKDIRNIRHSDIAANYSLNVKQIYDAYIKHIDKEWNEIMENLK